jgi:four helix bundle protein
MNRYSVKDKNHFLEMAYGLLMEVSSQFEIAEELGYINNADRQNMDALIDEVARLISGLQKSFKNE